MRYVYADQDPHLVIVEMAPQWFGQYHAHRPETFTSDALPPVNLLIASSYFYRALAGALRLDMDAAIIGALTLRASAAALEKPSDGDVTALAQHWDYMVSEVGGSDLFDWSSFPPEGRAVLTLSRAFEQNPRDDFAASDAAEHLASAVDYLTTRGARVCLVELPVTAELAASQRAIPGSRYAEFDTYAARFAAARGLKWIRPANLSRQLDNSYFSNQDHLNKKGHAEMWPQVEKFCFD